MFKAKKKLFKTAAGKQRLSSLIDVLDYYDLPSEMYLAWMKKWNSKQPYHNYHHLASVALNCVNAAKFYSVSFSDTQLLIVAAIAHDLNHTANSTVLDTVNIEKALEKTDFLFHVTDFLKDEKLNQEKVLELIRKTNTSVKHNHLTLGETILVESDLLQTVSEVDRELWLDALNDETGGTFTVDSTLRFLKPKLTLDWSQSVLKNTYGNNYNLV